MQGFLATFLITIGLGQIISSSQGWRAASLVGPSRVAGYGLGLALLLSGALILPASWLDLGWTLPAGLLALGVLVLGGSYIAPSPHPDRLFSPDQPGHAGCQPVQIPDGEFLMPGFLLRPLPAAAQTGAAVCVIPGAGDYKTCFKWRLVEALLAEGLTVLTIDPPGHGDYRYRPLVFPECLSALPAAVQFLRRQPGINRVGVAGISLGGALAIRSVVEEAARDQGNYGLVEALAVLETPVSFNHSRALIYREAWRTFRAPVLSLWREISVKQMIQSWKRGGCQSPHSTTELFALLDPLENIRRIKQVPLLLVYSNRDPIAPPQTAQAMSQAAPQAELLTSTKASHVTLTLLPEINRQVARWLRQQLTRTGKPTN